ncbi:MAG: MBL fold metallo-hydrolase [Acidimicrobiales bacterium]
MQTTITLPNLPAKTRLAPTKLASDTYLIHDHQGEGTAPVCVPLNSMVIRGAEPIVVDTGMPEHREQYFTDLFSIVEPEDIRWVFISHDDVDHTGNLNELMSLAPNATVVGNWFLMERMGASLAVSPLRQRWVGDGEKIDLGDRTLVAVRPPVYDSPTTRGLFDPTTGVYWASDCFATPMPTPVRDVAALDPMFWDDGMLMFNQYVSPWLGIVDDAKYQATVDRVQALGASVIAGCHTPLIGRSHIDQAISAARRSNSAVVPPQPDQAVLAQIQQTLGAH